MKIEMDERLKQWSWMFFLGFVYSLAISEPLKNILWGILVALYLYRRIRLKSCPKLDCVTGCLLAYLSIASISTFFAIEQSASLKGLWDLIRSTMIFLISSDILEDDEKKIQFLRHLIYATAIASLYGIYEYIVERQGEHPETVRVQLSSVGHFNQSGIYLGMAWLAGLATFITKSFYPRPWVGRVSLILISAAFLGTTARTALAVSLGISFLLFLFRRKSKRLIYIWILCLLTGLGMMFTTPGFAARVFSRGSFGTRVEIWESAWDMIQLRPWVGIGLNNFKNIFLTHAKDVNSWSIDHAHNVYLNALVQTGCLGFIAFLGVSVSSLYLILKSRSQRFLFFFPALGAWGVVFGVGMSNTTLHHENAILYFLLLGLVQKQTAREKGENDRPQLAD